MLSQGIGFVLFPVLARIFSPRDYGIIDLVGLVATIVNLTIALEVSQCLGRYFADAKTDDERGAYASTAFAFTLGMYTAALAVALLLISPLTRLVLGRNVSVSIMIV